MKRIAVFCALLLLAGLSIACNRETGNREQDMQQLRDNEVQWNQDFAAKDGDKLATYYADNAIMMVPGQPPINGKDAIHNALRKMVDDPAFALRFQANRIDVAASSDVAYTQGSYTYSSTDPRTKKVVTDRGSYVTTFRRSSDGSWKAVADIASSELPAGDMK